MNIRSANSAEIVDRSCPFSVWKQPPHQRKLIDHRLRAKRRRICASFLHQVMALFTLRPADFSDSSRFTCLSSAVAANSPRSALFRSLYSKPPGQPRQLSLGQPAQASLQRLWFCARDTEGFHLHPPSSVRPSPPPRLHEPDDRPTGRTLASASAPSEEPTFATTSTESPDTGLARRSFQRYDSALGFAKTDFSPA